MHFFYVCNQCLCAIQDDSFWNMKAIKERKTDLFERGLPRFRSCSRRIFWYVWARWYPRVEAGGPDQNLFLLLGLWRRRRRHWKKTGERRHVPSYKVSPISWTADKKLTLQIASYAPRFAPHLLCHSRVVKSISFLPFRSISFIQVVSPTPPQRKVFACGGDDDDASIYFSGDRFPKAGKMVFFLRCYPDFRPLRAAAKRS